MATLESEERVKELEKMKRDEEELEKFRRAAAEADKSATSKPIIHNEPVPSSVKVNTLKHDSQRMILANAVKKTAKPIRKKSLPSPTVGQESLSLTINEEPTSPTSKREPHGSDEQERESKRIKTEQSNDTSPQKQKEIAKDSNEKQSSSDLNFSFIENKSVSQNEKIEEVNTNSNPLSSLLGYSDNSSDEEDTS